MSFHLCLSILLIFSLTSCAVYKVQPEIDLTKVRVLENSAKYPHAGRGVQCFEPYLLVLSLGIIPAICKQEYTLKVEDLEGGTGPRVITVTKKGIVGWLGLFFVPFPSWKFGSPDLYKWELDPKNTHEAK